MAKVIKVFRERYHDMKRYEIGDEYPEKDKKRVDYLIKHGYLKRETISIEEFEELKANEQKELLSKLKINGDDSNEEKRLALYKNYLYGADK